MIGPTLRDGRASLAIAIDGAEAAAFEAVRRAAEAALAAAPGVRAAAVALTADRAARSEPSPSGQSALRLPDGVARVIAVGSGKGGVGKSTTAANLALALRADGWRVGLLDADVQGPSAPRIFGLRGVPRTLPDRRLAPLDGWGVKVMSIGSLVDPEEAMVWRGPMVLAAVTQMLFEVAWGPLDALVVDLPPGTGDAALAVAQATPLTGAVVVSTPQDLSLIDARRGVAMFAKLGVPVLGLVENMSVFVCPTCGTSHALFGAGGARAEAARLGLPLLAEVPLTLDLRLSADAGRPPTAVDPEGAIASVYRMMAREVRMALEGTGGPLAQAGAAVV